MGELPRRLFECGEEADWVGGADEGDVNFFFFFLANMLSRFWELWGNLG